MPNVYLHLPKLTPLILWASVIAAMPLPAQTRQTEDARREAWQKVDQIFAAMGVRAGATVADVGAGDGFFTSRLARAVGSDGRVFALDVDEKALARLKNRLADEGIRNVSAHSRSALDSPRFSRTGRRASSQGRQARRHLLQLTG